MENNTLAHYGVKGMKWGVRKYYNKDGQLSKRGQRHQQAAVKMLRNQRDHFKTDAETMKQYMDTNNRILKESKKLDAAKGQKSWQTRSLEDANKQIGQQYIQDKYNMGVLDAYVDAFSNGTLKVGEDYAMKAFNRGIKLTESGRRKETEIENKMYEAFNKRASNR